MVEARRRNQRGFGGTRGRPCRKIARGVENGGSIDRKRERTGRERERERENNRFNVPVALKSHRLKFGNAVRAYRTDIGEVKSGTAL